MAENSGLQTNDASSLELCKRLLNSHIDTYEQYFKDADDDDDDDDDVSQLTTVDTDDYKVIWLDSNETLNNEHRSLIESRLRMIFSTAEMFDNGDLCASYLELLPNESKLFFLGNGDDHERIKQLTKRFRICHLFWNRKSVHDISSFIYLKGKFIELRDEDDAKEELEQQKRFQENIDNYDIIWLRQKSIDNDVIQRMNVVFDRLITFDDRQACFEYMNSSIDMKTPIFLILFDYIDVTIPETNKTIKSVYSMRSTEISLSKQKSFDNIEQLIMTLRRDIRALADDFPFHVVEKSIRKLDSKYAPYTSFMGLLDVFISLTRDDNHHVARIDFLKSCRAQYIDNQRQLDAIDQFAQEYQSFEQAIGWYTRDSFIYRLVNQALRSQNPDIVHKYRYFISELMHHLDILHELEKQKVDETQLLTVYRGQGMHIRELNKLKRQVGSEFALNSFYSATLDQDIGTEFALIATNGSDIVSVLVIVNIDRKLVYTRPFAIIEHLSVIPDEREVLIAMGSVFCLQSIEFNKEISVWIVRMILVEHDKDDVKQLKVNPSTHSVSFETYQGTPSSFDNGVHPLFNAAMHDTIMVHNYIRSEKNTCQTIQQETEELKKEMQDIFYIYGEKR